MRAFGRVAASLRQFAGIEGLEVVAVPEPQKICEGR
jgi:hypothetical protein